MAGGRSFPAGTTIAHQCAYRPIPEQVLDRILGQGGKIYLQNSLGQNVIHVVIAHGSVASLRCLLRVTDWTVPANVQALHQEDYMGKNPLFRALEGRQPSRAQALMAQPAMDLNQRMNNGGNVRRNWSILLALDVRPILQRGSSDLLYKNSKSGWIKSAGKLGPVQAKVISSIVDHVQ